MTIYLCNNTECCWIGWESETVHPKHDPTFKVCPECHETCETMSPAWLVDIFNENGIAKAHTNEPAREYPF